MNIHEIKNTLGVEQLNFNQGVDVKTNENTDWFSHWNNTKRERYCIHKDLLAELQAGAPKNLVLTPVKEYTGKQGLYTIRTIYAVDADVTM